MHRFLALASLTLTLPLAGCGGADIPEVGEVSGTITIDGKPASGVMVQFTPTAGGRSSMAQTDENGYYELVYSSNSTGALIGSHNVMIAPSPPPMDDNAARTTAPLMEDKSIPKQYLDMKKQVEVKAGDNTIDLTYP